MWRDNILHVLFVVQTEREGEMKKVQFPIYSFGWSVGRSVGRVLPLLFLSFFFGSLSAVGSFF